MSSGNKKFRTRLTFGWGYQSILDGACRISYSDLAQEHRQFPTPDEYTYDCLCCHDVSSQENGYPEFVDDRFECSTPCVMCDSYYWSDDSDYDDYYMNIDDMCYEGCGCYEDYVDLDDVIVPPGSSADAFEDNAMQQNTCGCGNTKLVIRRECDDCVLDKASYRMGSIFQRHLEQRTDPGGRHQLLRAKVTIRQLVGAAR